MNYKKYVDNPPVRTSGGGCTTKGSFLLSTLNCSK